MAEGYTLSGFDAVALQELEERIEAAKAKFQARIDEEVAKRGTVISAVDINRLAQYLYEEGGTKVSAMTDKATLVAALTRALERTGAEVTGEAYRG
ncbi:hypothetical protein SEA_MERCEDES_54 [Microbacterium phage Mercedes]|nr:hypothetical protein SEA_MERCEDES_54 [Microbacterium phage Mercedes]